ncbi:unnamed protein product [Cuscuta europaea]|uniref:Uncharacterized protein n=1 Tax=Cuscuta europaea TaxID=41803 RepID=A0A9P0ZZB6_CUSEU|nr:unnamed protein product [Cuscuta europaea]
MNENSGWNPLFTEKRIELLENNKYSEKFILRHRSEYNRANTIYSFKYMKKEIHLVSDLVQTKAIIHFVKTVMTQSCIGYRRSAFARKSHKPSEVKTPGRTAARYVPSKSEGQRVLVSLLAHRTSLFHSQIDGTLIKKELIPLLYRTGS